MEYSIIETQENGLENIPPVKTYYFGPTDTYCIKREKALCNNFIFEIFTYDIKGNGVKVIKIFTSEGEQLFVKITITLRYTWHPGFSVQFKNDESVLSSSYFKFIAQNNGLSLESILQKLSDVAEKRNSLTKEFPSIQYVSLAQPAHLQFLPMPPALSLM